MTLISVPWQESICPPAAGATGLAGIVFKGDDCTQANGGLSVEFLELQLFELGQGRADFIGPIRLPLGDVRCFKGQGGVFIVRDVFFVGRCRMGGFGRLQQQGMIGLEFVDDLLA